MINRGSQCPLPIVPDSANSRKRILRDSKNRAESADSSGFRANSCKRILRILKPCRIPANSRKRILRIPGTVPNADDIDGPDPYPKNLRFLKLIKTPSTFSARSAEKFWGILSVYRDLQGKLGKIRQAFENNKNPLTTFQISRARNNKNPSQEFPENGRNFSLRGGFIINFPVVRF